MQPVEAPVTSVPADLTLSGAAPRTGPRARRVLVIDDDADTADSLCILLNINGFEAVAAYGSAAALETARRWGPDVVVCDIALPGTDGLALAQAFRSNKATADAWLVAVSGYARPEDRRRAFAAGFDCHLAKPVNFAELKRLLGPAVRA